jgi:uncharacterized Zn finger protein (UPF0148 family)
MFCTECGAPLVDSPAFCPTCGTSALYGSPFTATPDSPQNQLIVEESIGANRFVSSDRAVSAASYTTEGGLPMRMIVLGGLATLAAASMAAYVIKPSLFVESKSNAHEHSIAAPTSANNALPIPPPPKRIDLTCEIHIAGRAHIMGRLRFLLDDADKSGMLTAYSLSREMFSPPPMQDVLGVSAKYWYRLNSKNITVVTPGGYLGWSFEFNREEGTVRVIQQMGGNWWEGDCDQHTGF